MVIDARGISLVYDSNMETKTYALKSVDISLKNGEFVGVIGPSGSGKSSLLYLLSGLKKPTSGTVYYDDGSPGSGSFCSCPSYYIPSAVSGK
jgi:putative ABC transport system ATP-binding protein